MRKRVFIRANVENKEIKNINEHLVNTGIKHLEDNPNQFTEELIELLNKHNMIDKEDDIVEFELTIKS